MPLLNTMQIILKEVVGIASDNLKVEPGCDSRAGNVSADTTIGDLKVGSLF